MTASLIRRSALVVLGMAIAAAMCLAQTPTIVLRGIYNAESTGNVLTLPFTEWWPAAQNDGGGYFTGWNYGADSPSVTLDTGTNTYVGLQTYSDGATQQVQRQWHLPTDWTGTIDLRLIWKSAATSGNVVWQIATTCIDDGETDDPAFNAAQTITDATKGSANQFNDASLSSVTTTGCSPGDVMMIKVFRDPAHASDTLGATASLVGVEITYRRSI